MTAPAAGAAPPRRALCDHGHSWPAEHVIRCKAVHLPLRDGTEVVLRPIRARDKRMLERGMRRLSPQSARLRFLAPKDHLTLAELRYLTEIDYIHHYAVVAVLADDPDELVGVGRWVRDPARPHSAEVAIAVGDPLQGKGLGTAIGQELAEAASARGITEFTATILPENVAAQRLFARMSDHVRSRVTPGAYELAADLAP
jgi:RimJ/RimL family protein N-acetyltransferase